MPVQWNDPERHIRVGAARGLNRGATVLMGESQSRAPVDQTDLRNSAATHDATPDNLQSAVTYDTPYAVVQHERLDFNHPTDHNPNAQAKYLESAAIELRDDISAVVAADIRRETG
ncbi:hypothetical protein AB0230_07065 [Microbacterium sp. NPDC089190]|uniref:hypothetical protein n=1 Tax=Microbacterium sp. NPDC089190 TaxID=3155063 RepID=UPI00344C7BEA